MMVYINPILLSSPPPHPPPPCVHSIRSVMQKYLEERDELTFDKIFNQKIGKSEQYIIYTFYVFSSIALNKKRVRSSTNN